MFLALFFFMLTLQSVQDDASRWMEAVESGNLEQLQEEIRQQPGKAKTVMEELLVQFDSSIHSWRDRPEQRRVRYSDTLLRSGLELSLLVTEVTGDNTLQRRFEARRDRVKATELLNDAEFQKAMSLIESVRDTAEELEDKSFLFSTYLSSAYAYLGTGDPERALAHCEMALRLAREIGEKVKQTLALFNVGTAHLHLGHYDQAYTYSIQAAEAAEKIGNLIWQANAWLNVGYVQIMKHDYESAIDSLGRTLTLSQESGDPLGEGRAYYNLGIVYSKQKQWNLAREHLEHSLKFIREVDIRHSHDIDEYNYVERDAMRRLLYSYQQLNVEDPAVLEPIQHRLEEFEHMSGSTQGHTH
ncbi:tetratricopeptide repeat protein [Acidobacteria bacterium AH-259-D05]|nr:tetratricopeptide repeat protein [Acidobacteria bacterium AH-259-D05]